jgi:hypothetical protein
MAYLEYLPPVLALVAIALRLTVIRPHLRGDRKKK